MAQGDWRNRNQDNRDDQDQRSRWQGRDWNEGGQRGGGQESWGRGSWDQGREGFGSGQSGSQGQQGGEWGRMGRYGDQGWQNESGYRGYEGNYGMDRDYGRSSYGGSYGGSFGGEDYSRAGQRSRPFVGESSYGQGYSGYSGSRGYGSGYGSSRGNWGGQGGQQGERNFWDRASDEVSSWFGDDEARRRRDNDEHRGRGPRGYTRSDDRIREDVNDRLTDDGWIDASDIDVQVSSGEVTLTGQVRSRNDKRRAEDLAETVSGVKHVQNNLRVKDQSSSGESATLVAGHGSSGSSSTGTSASGTSSSGTGTSTASRGTSRT